MPNPPPDVKIKIRDLPPTAIRLSPDLRAALLREAAISGRSMHAEIVTRLKNSIEGADQQNAGDQGTHEPRPGYLDLTDVDKTMLTIFRKMTVEKQLALLSLFR